MNTLQKSLAVGLALFLGACQQSEQAADAEVPAETPAEAAEAPAAREPAAAKIAVAGTSLAAILEAQPQDTKARYPYRRPQETLEFFGIEPGMNVLEALPGGGWYTKILVPYLGTDGTLVGVDYNKSMFPLFGFYSDEQLAAKETWAEDWRETARGWFDTPAADIEAFAFGAMPAHMEEELDAALFIRALHNMARFAEEGDFLNEALADTMRALKPGGIVGIVQHMAPEDAPAEWANGSAGYLKKSDVIATLEAAGFVFVAESDINANPKDQPTTDDIVWRLPPMLMTSRDNPEAAEAFRTIGESTRMTLLFRKPA